MTLLHGHGFTRKDVTLSNWRNRPYSSWSLQNVQELVPSAIIEGNGISEGPIVPLSTLGDIKVPNAAGELVSLVAFLQECQTDSFIVMRKGDIVAEWYGPTCDRHKPHLTYSISKSITGILAGILVDRGILSVDDPVARHVPEAAHSAYADATLRDLLDMEVALDFNEDYLDKTGAFDRYRRSTGWNPPSLNETSPDLASFLCSLKKSTGEHGQVHLYRSPNADMAGIVLERATATRIPTLISELLWKPMGAFSHGFITVDSIGTSRTAGGISVTPRDLTRFGDMVRQAGKNIVPESWIKDLWTGGNRSAWRAGDQADDFPGGSYRSCWYETGLGELAAIGIHGQWIWIDPAAETVIVKQSCQELPTDEQLDRAIRGMMRIVAKA
jgi:CubicO group peptidase (beta-lactamase class C family)